ncbi:MAG: hypothetical protein R3C13_00755 [Hyphomonas sp.]|uniref:hypothetical protein n=1 Tax=Hyphomonas sp. TaxID=87 RepID=UPI003529B965
MSAEAFQKGLPIGIALGISIGVALGVAVGNMGLMGAGLAVGIGLAPMFGAAMLKKETRNKDEKDGN